MLAQGLMCSPPGLKVHIVLIANTYLLIAIWPLPTKDVQTRVYKKLKNILYKDFGLLRVFKAKINGNLARNLCDFGFNLFSTRSPPCTCNVCRTTVRGRYKYTYAWNILVARRWFSMCLHDPGKSCR